MGEVVNAGEMLDVLHWVISGEKNITT